MFNSYFRTALLQSESTLFDVCCFSILFFGRSWRWIDRELLLLLSFGKSLFIRCVKLAPILSMFSCYSFIKWCLLLFLSSILQNFGVGILHMHCGNMIDYQVLLNVFYWVHLIEESSKHEWGWNKQLLICSSVAPYMQIVDTKMRRAIPLETKVAIAISRLATSHGM